MTFVSYAQNFEDVLLWRALKHVKHGFYVDIGASHPDTDSVTRAFYDHGWQGINVEPTGPAYQRLLAARPRDTNLRLALGLSRGSATFYSIEGANSGLSTLDDAAAARYAELGIETQSMTIETDTLAAVCTAHAPADIHFLKIDVEGAERLVLEGADFGVHRPWIILAEATAPMSMVETHAGWEPILLQAAYRFVWFDGLNRYYIAEEHHDTLAPHFRTPPNVFDDFIRVADTEWARRIHQAEAQRDAVMQRALAAEQRCAVAQDRAEAAQLRLAYAQVEAARATTVAEKQAVILAAQASEATQAAAEMRHAVAVAEDAMQRANESTAWLDAMQHSTSWRITRPLRQVMARRGRPSERPDVVPRAHAETAAAPQLDAPPIVPRSGPSQATPRHAVHQFHSGTAAKDAITNAMLLTQRLLGELGYDSRIFAEHIDPAVEQLVHHKDNLPQHDRYVLILHHSMGHDALDQMLAATAPKILFYHNITPPELLAGTPFLQQYAKIGRTQIDTIRPQIETALADSEYNAIELRRRGYTSVAACTLLFDLDAMPDQAPKARVNPEIFTVLFVGRICASKAQKSLVAAFSQFRDQFQGTTQLVLVGRQDDHAAISDLLALIRRNGLDHGAVDLPGLVSDAELERRYAAADLYVSASRHEGFGVPLVEAAVRGIPVLALAAGAVPYTLGVAEGLIDEDSPAAVAAAMLALANDPQRRQALAAAQAAGLRRYAIANQLPILIEALVLAGATAPVSADAHAAIVANARFTVAGHVNGTYSLAEVNRSLALALEAARPGAVRILPVEGSITTDVAHIPASQRDGVGALLARPEPLTGPEITISQHYPVYVPPTPGDVPMALFFWEESLVPEATVAALNAGFRGVLAPTSFVAKALIDSGVTIPVRVIGHTPNLTAFEAIGRQRLSGRRDPSRPFTFLHVSSAFPRKGLDVLLAAYARAFIRTDAVHLVVKTFPNPHNTAAADLACLRGRHPDLAPVTLIDQDLTEADLAALYRDADMVVLPTRGEGYNLPAAEALAAGIPLITTGFGGHMDFVPHAPPLAVRLLTYRFAPSGSHLATPFSLWAEPSEPDLVEALRQALLHGPRPVEPLLLPRADPAAAIAGFAADLLLAPPRPPPAIGWVTTWDVRCGIAEYSRNLLGTMPGTSMVFADLRTDPGTAGGRPVHPAWRAGDPEMVPALVAAILQQDPQALVLQHQPGLIPWVTLAKFLSERALAGRVVCLTLHNTQDLADSPEPVRERVIAALARMSRVVVHTSQDLNRLATLGLVHNTTLIPHGAVPRLLASPDAPRALSRSDDILIGCYGFFLPDKGIGQLIEALPLLRRSWPKARLRLVNAQYPLFLSTDEMAACKTLVASLGLGDSVEFMTDFMAPAASEAALAACDLIALPYQRSKEGSSAALRTALASGVPVAVTPLPLFDEAKACVLPLPGIKPADISAGLHRALGDRDARVAAVAAGDEWLGERDWARIGRRWHAMLQGLVASNVVVATDRWPTPGR